MTTTRLRRMARTAIVAIALVATSCGPDSPTAPPVSETPEVQAGLLGNLGNLVGTLLTCRPLPYDVEAKWIGPAGGSLSVGPHTLVIPAGALAAPVRIRAEIVVDTVNSVRLYPHGLQFARPARLTMSYANCGLVPSLLPKRIAYVDEQLTILEYLLSLDQVLQKKVTGRIDHFSRYAVGW